MRRPAHLKRREPANILHGPEQFSFSLFLFFLFLFLMATRKTRRSCWAHFGAAARLDWQFITFDGDPGEAARRVGSAATSRTAGRSTRPCPEIPFNSTNNKFQVRRFHCTLHHDRPAILLWPAQVSIHCLAGQESHHLLAMKGAPERITDCARPSWPRTDALPSRWTRT